ncbi:nucleotidyltransferase domain-containing protein [Geobacter sp.]|uniref:nucleotidyltransferase domain-containing protein n=1 Tax=Geobacter sp. TaxID=46610 RepID=UPI002627BAE4|nr:nucleotidyltransferase domain-containing protein [Geobacter sp.]
MAPDRDEPFGLKRSTIGKITGVFAAVPEVEEVILYGSRAKGNYRHGSDIDLTVKGKDLTLTLLLKIEGMLDDLLLPYKIDLSLFDSLDDPDLMDHIRRVGIVIYAKAGMPGRLPVNGNPPGDVS